MNRFLCKNRGSPFLFLENRVTSSLSYLAAPNQADGAVPGRVERHQSVDSRLVRRAREAERRLGVNSIGLKI